MTKMWRRRMGGMILCSMACTTVMLAVQGRIREAIPLHLCSVSALAAAVLAFMPVQPIVDYLWLLGMPGAILALVFPAPAVSRWQTLFTACYMLTHALIVLIGLSAMAMGECPREIGVPVQRGRPRAFPQRKAAPPRTPPERAGAVDGRMAEAAKRRRSKRLKCAAGMPCVKRALAKGASAQKPIGFGT